MTLFARSLSRFLTTPATEVTGQSEISSERAALIAAAREWGYFAGAIKNRRDLWHGRRMLDVGMGGGPHSLSFIEGGALSYVGVDPLIGTDHVRDFRNMKDSSIPAYHAFPFSAADIMRLNPNIHLYSGDLEDVAETLKEHTVDIAIMDAVSEHLARPEQVIRTVWDLLDCGGLVWIGHCNYYSWTGHHRAPRSVAAWQTDDPEQARHVDWRHLDPEHPDYSNPNLNRVRLEEQPPSPPCCV